MAPSAFEARRLANLANNEKLLKDSAQLGGKIASAAKAPPRPRATVPKRKASEISTRERTRTIPTRSSARIAGQEATHDALTGDLADDKFPSAAPLPKRKRVSGDLDLSGLEVKGQRWATGAEAFASFVQGAQPGVRTFTKEDIEDTKDEKLKDVREGLDSLTLYDGWVPNDIKLTPERAYALTFHPASDKPVILAGDKKGTLGVFDASQESPKYPDEDDEDQNVQIPLPKISAFEIHTRTISSIKIPAVDPNSVITSSYDSTIRCLDIQKQVSTQLWQPEDEDTDLAITCIDIPPEDKDTIVFSTLDGSLGRFDRRSKDKAEIWGLIDNKIGGFSLCPVAPHLVATASLDRTLKIWDMRMMKGKGDLKHPSLLGEHESRLSVSHASWSRNGYIATSSYDDTVKIYDASDALKWKPGHNLSEDKMTPTTKIPHNNQTGRWVTILKPQWQLAPADGVEKFAIANMNRFVDVYDSKGTQLAQLSGDGITAVPAVAELHPTRNWVAGGTASGKLCLWM